MTEHSAGTASDNCSHPTTVVGDVTPAYHVNPAMQGVKPTRPDSVMDRLGRIPNLAQLIAGHNPMLIFGQTPRLPRHPSPFLSPIIRRLES
jgi:hypothetical protein